MLITDFIPEGFNYFKYISQNKIDKILNITKIPKNPEDKINKTITSSVDPNNTIPFPPELDDLSRLHYIARDRKVNTILEFGVGKSSLILADALYKNKKSYEKFVKENLRKSNLFEIYSVDNHEKWIEKSKNNLEIKYVDECISNFHFSNLIISEFAGKVCSFYENLPNISPDLIYLDGPDQFSAKGEIRGLSTRHQDRFPMAADILSFEHFLHPGTLIIIDGRTANARFLKSNLQRDWSYSYFKDWDQHFFELLEEPLGKYNKKMIDHCLGSSFYTRLNSFN
tara:strand:- start:57 stop:905 length:849 start_codon:yes stop_codon:yes gene_type:complete